MKKLAIKWQLGVVAAITAIGMILMAVLQYNAVKKVESLENARVLVSDIESGMLTLRRNEKDFLARKNLKYQEKFEDNQDITQQRVERLGTLLTELDLDKAITTDLAVILDIYKKGFLSIAELQKKIGLDHKQGLYGALRKAVHQAEGLMKAQKQDKLSKDMLMLRRREKDFMLRNDLKYVKKFDADMAVLKQDLSSTAFSSDVKENITTAMVVYERDFKSLVEAKVKLGLSSKEGLLGEMRNTIHQSELVLDRLREDTGQRLNTNISVLSGQAIATSAILTIVILGLIAFIVLGITRPVRQFASLIKDASKARDMTVRSNIDGPQELATMSYAFNEMMAEFQEMISEIKDSSMQLGTATVQLNSVTQSSREDMDHQLSDTEQVATAMNEMTATVQEVADHANAAASASRSADEEAMNGRTVVEQNQESIQLLAGEVANAATVINDLSQESENIGTVLNVIREIADQTNLLALNAAIEAARAGEQGRGFAVVADEVRTLAQRSQNSTQEIEVIVERLQQTADRAVTAMEKGKSRAQESVDRSQSAAESLNAILQAIVIIKDMNEQIAFAAKEQASVSEEINKNIVNISDATKRTSLSSEQTMQTGHSLMNFANMLNDLLARFKVA